MERGILIAFLAFFVVFSGSAFAAPPTPPIITMTSPQNITYPLALLDLNVSADMAIDTWWYSLNGGANQTFVPNTTINASEGLNWLVVYANTSKKKTNYSVVYFTVDTPPSITITSPYNTTYTTTLIDLNVSANQAIDTWWYSLNAGTDSVFIPNTTITAFEGLNKLVIYANDTAGNTNFSELYFTADSEPPIITLDSPDNATYNTTLIELNVSAGEVVDTWWYSLNGGSISTFVPNTTISGKLGLNWLVVYANDTLGNTNSSEVYFTVAKVNIASCSVLGAPGFYTLISDINASGTCLTIGADNIVLDGAGHTITGDGSGSGVYAFQRWEVTVKNLIIEDFSSGIYSRGGNDNMISNNTLTSNGDGIYLRDTEVGYPQIEDNNASNNVNGIHFNWGGGNVVNNNLNSNTNHGIYGDVAWCCFAISNNTINSNGIDGIHLLAGRAEYIITNNTIMWNSNFGFYLANYSIWADLLEGSLIYNNLFNNTNNFYMSRVGNNSWNSSKTLGTNIIGGKYLGGNFWGKPNGMGFSDACTDSDNDGICDSNYSLASGNVDYLPLAKPDITIYSPKNTTYPTSLIDLNVSANIEVDTWWYNLNTAENVEFTPNNTVTGVEGLNKIVVFANGTNVDIVSSTVYFTVNTNTTNFNISLIPEWNMISIPLEQDNWSINSTLSSIEGNYSVVFAYVNGTWQKSTSRRFPMTNMSIEYGYWINMTAYDTLELNGTVPSSTTIDVIPEWNLVGYPTLDTRNLTEVLSTINYTVVFTYMNGTWQKSTSRRFPMTNMTPGYGYWINATEYGSYDVIN